MFTHLFPQCNTTPLMLIHPQGYKTEVLLQNDITDKCGSSLKVKINHIDNYSVSTKDTAANLNS